VVIYTFSKKKKNSAYWGMHAAGISYTAFIGITNNHFPCHINSLYPDVINLDALCTLCFGMLSAARDI
jgi:hypothetical protein